MPSVRRPLALMAALAVLAGGTLAAGGANGQEKTKPKVDDKKAAPKAAPKADDKKKAAPSDAKLGSVVISKSKSKGTWRYIIKDENGKSIAMPLAQVSYESKEECLKAIDFLKETLAKTRPVEGDERE